MDYYNIWFRLYLYHQYVNERVCVHERASDYKEFGADPSACHSVKSTINSWRNIMHTSNQNVDHTWNPIHYSDGKNERDGVSNHRCIDFLLNRLYRRRSTKTPKLCVTGACGGNSPVTGEFPAQRASNAENVSIWWHHHAMATFEMVKYLSIVRYLYCQAIPACFGKIAISGSGNLAIQNTQEVSQQLSLEIEKILSVSL